MQAKGVKRRQSFLIDVRKYFRNISFFSCHGDQSRGSKDGTIKGTEARQSDDEREDEAADRPKYHASEFESDRVGLGDDLQGQYDQVRPICQDHQTQYDPHRAVDHDG